MSKEEIKDLKYFIDMTNMLLQYAEKLRETDISIIPIKPTIRGITHEFYHELQTFKKMHPEKYKIHQKDFDQVLKESEFLTTYKVYIGLHHDYKTAKSDSQFKKLQYEIDKEFKDARKNLENLLKKEPKKVAKALYESSKADSVVRDDDRVTRDEASNELMQTMLYAISPELTHKVALISERMDELKARDETVDINLKQPKTFKQKLQSFCKAIGRLITRKHIVKDKDLQKALEDFNKLKRYVRSAADIEISDKSKQIYGRFTERLASISSKSKSGHSR
jgi:methyl-accepting chemotaxis protein